MAQSVVGVFESEKQAEEAVSSLRKSGFKENEVSIVAKENGRGGNGKGGNGREQEGRGGLSFGNQDLGEGTWTGTAVGGLAGLLAGAGTLAIPGLGPILAIGPLAGILTGAVTGGIGGALVDFGIPETRGKELEKRVKEGKILALVRTEQDKVDKAESIFKDRGAKDVEVHEANGRRGGHH